MPQLVLNTTIVTIQQPEAVEQILVWGGGRVSKFMTWCARPKLGGSGGMPPPRKFLNIDASRINSGAVLVDTPLTCEQLQQTEL